jgi:hypothetical protein
MKTTVKITKRASGYAALVTYPWGAKVRLTGYATKDMARGAATKEIDRKRAYTLDSDLAVSRR